MEVRFFEDGDVPIFTTPEWYEGIERAPHLEQPGHRGRLLLAYEYVAEALYNLGLHTVSDMGCGDGGLLQLLKERYDGVPITAWGYDLMPENIKAAKEERGVAVEFGDAVAGDVVWGQIAVMTEMVEHLVDPHGFLAGIPDSVRAVVASSPDNETPESHYEFHTWGWDMAGYRAMFEAAGFDVVRHETIGFQLLLGVKP